MPHITIASCPDGLRTGDQWQAARTLVCQLEKEEAGLADDPPIGKMGPEYEPLLIEFLRDPLVRNGFNTVPTEVAIVELDRLVVYQEHIDVTFARQLEKELGPSPTREQIFRACLPYDHPQPPVQWSRARRDKFVFLSPSNDLRFLGPMQLKPSHIRDYPSRGDLVGVVGLSVGFGSNSSRDELDVVASSDVRRNPDFYLNHARPPMLRDYFNPKLHVVMPVHRRTRQVTVRFEVEEDYIPEL